jgi:ankyrin repeat protein
MFMRHLGSASLILLLSVARLGAAGTDASLAVLVKAGNREAVRTLLRRSPEAVNVVEADGTSALHWAVRVADAQIVRMLLDAGANPNTANRRGVTPLLLAATNADAAMAVTLIKAGANVGAPVSGGQTVLMVAARTGSPQTVAALLERGADVNARERVMGESALMWAAAENHDGVIKVLAAAHADVDARSSTMSFSRAKFGDGRSARFTVLPRGGWTALMYAARQNAPAAVRALAAAGADLNATDPDGTTALTLAIINAHYDVAALLLESGADPNVADSAGMTPLYAAIDMNTLDETPGRPAPIPSGDLDAPAIVRLLLAHGANANAALKGTVLERVHNNGDGTLGAGATPLMRAARKGDVALMRLLLDHGADATRRTAKQGTAFLYLAGLGGLGRFGEYDLTRATDKEFVEGMKLCLEHGSEIGETDDSGQTALHIAVIQREASSVRFLIDRGARLDARDRQGRTALDVAQGVGARPRGAAAPALRTDIVELLRGLTPAASSTPRSTPQ